MTNFVRTPSPAFALGGFLSAPCALAALIDGTLVAQDCLSDRIVVRDTHMEGSEIVVDLVNRTTVTVRDIRLLVPDSPRAVTIAGPIFPRSRVRVRAALPVKSSRAARRFEPRIEILGLVAHDRFLEPL